MIHSGVYWQVQEKQNDLPPLNGTVQADVVIVGGGMAGLMCAQELSKAGKKVALIEREYCGAGASGKTSGFITPDSEIELSALVDMHGPKKAKAIWEFVLSGVHDIRTAIKTHEFSCDYQIQDSLYIANHQSRVKYPRWEYEARTELGYQSRLYTKKELSGIIGSDGYFAAVRYPHTFGINSYLYCQSMKKVLLDAGVMIFEQSAVTEILPTGVQTAHGNVYADQVIVCADRFIPEFGVLRKEIYHVQTFLGISKPLREDHIHHIFPDEPMMTWDTDLVYNYFRVTGDNRLLIGGGDVFYTYARTPATNSSRFVRRLSGYINRKFPEIPIEIEYMWPGMLGVSKDLQPIMGPDPKMPNVWYVGAATGLPWAAALGKYAADRLVSGRNEFDELFSPNRKFVIGRRLQSIIGTPSSFALSHGVVEFF